MSISAFFSYIGQLFMISDFLYLSVFCLRCFFKPIFRYPDASFILYIQGDKVEIVVLNSDGIRHEYEELRRD